MISPLSELDTWRELLRARLGESPDAYRIAAQQLVLRADGSLRLDFMIETAANGPPTTHWRCCASGLLDSRIEQWPADLWVETPTEHPVLWDYTQPSATVHFRGPVDCPARADSELRKVHHQLVGGWTSLDRYVLRARDGGSVFDSQRYGFLGTAPRLLSVAYADVLRRHGCEVQLIEHGAPESRPGWTADEPPPRLLLIDRRSYAVATEIDLTRLPPLA